MSRYFILYISQVYSIFNKITHFDFYEEFSNTFVKRKNVSLVILIKIHLNKMSS